MKTTFRLFTLTLMIHMLSGLVARAESKSATIPVVAAFEKLKSLAGDWTGTIGARGQGEPVAVNYKVTSAGHAVVETLFPGSKYEMVTVYHFDGNKLVLTHYCAAGNQPRMALTKKSTVTTLDFDYIGGGNMKSKKDGHMHAARLRFVGTNEIEAEWDSYKGGKLEDTKKFFMTRKR